MFSSNDYNLDHYYSGRFRYLKKKFLEELQKEDRLSYQELEYEGVITTVTDQDILKIQIDGALDSGNKELFMKLTSQLEELKCIT